MDLCKFCVLVDKLWTNVDKSVGYPPLFSIVIHIFPPAKNICSVQHRTLVWFPLWRNTAVFGRKKQLSTEACRLYYYNYYHVLKKDRTEGGVRLRAHTQGKKRKGRMHSSRVFPAKIQRFRLTNAASCGILPVTETERMQES